MARLLFVALLLAAAAAAALPLPAQVVLNAPFT
jgi:hypothetical protein